MEILKLIALLIGTVILFSACAPDEAYALSYQEKSFSAGLAWSVEGININATLTSIRNEDATRDLTLSFSAPESLAGITVLQRGDGSDALVKLGELEISSPGALRWLALREMFELEGDVEDTYLSDIDGVKVNAVEASTTSGDYTVYLLPSSALPRRICGEVNGQRISLDVIWFEVRDR